MKNVRKVTYEQLARSLNALCIMDDVLTDFAKIWPKTFFWEEHIGLMDFWGHSNTCRPISIFSHFCCLLHRILLTMQISHIPKNNFQSGIHNRFPTSCREIYHFKQTDLIMELSHPASPVLRSLTSGASWSVSTMSELKHVDDAFARVTA